MEEDFLTITREAHGTDMRDMLQGLWNSSEHYDVTLVCDDKTQINAHKAVLSACSPVFENLINENSSMIFLPDVGHEEMESIVKFMYLGQAKLSKVKIPSFVSLAENLGIKQMTDITDEKEEKLQKVKNENTDMDKSDVFRTKARKERKSLHNNQNYHGLLESLNGHVQGDNTRIILNCDQCDYQSGYLNRLQLHKRIVHEGQKKLNCKFCSYTADYPRKLQYHNRKHHSQSLVIED